MQDKASGSVALLEADDELSMIYRDPAFSKGLAKWEKGIEDGWMSALSEGDEVFVKSSSGVAKIRIEQIDRDNEMIRLKILINGLANSEGESIRVFNEPISVLGELVRWSFASDSAIFLYFDSVFDGKVDYHLGEHDDLGIRFYPHRFSSGEVLEM